MKDENKTHPLQGEQNQTPSRGEGTQTAVSGSFWKRLLAKKWVFPATYMAAAAIILTLMWAYQNTGDTTVTENEKGMDVVGSTTGDEAALPVTAATETMASPVKETEQLQATLGFFDVNDTSEDNQAAMVEYGDTFTPHYGIDYQSSNNETFEVLAALSGTVTRVQQVPVAGTLVEITHENGLKTIYQSLTDLRVAEGDKVAQGDLIAQAGRSELEKDLGIHLHFEVWENDTPVNPENFLQ